MNPDHIDVDAIPAAHWRLGDACELIVLESVHLEDFDVVIAATAKSLLNTPPRHQPGELRFRRCLTLAPSSGWVAVMAAEGGGEGVWRA